MNLFSCPQCQSNLKASDEMRGKRVRCPQCSNIFTIAAEPDTAQADVPKPVSVAAGPPPLPPAETSTTDFPRGESVADDRDSPRTRRSSRYDDDVALPQAGKAEAAWGVVRIGLLTLYISLVVFIFACLAGVLLFVLGGGMEAKALPLPGQRGPAPRPPFEIIAGVCILVAAAGASSLGYLVGMILCVFAPERRARGYMIGYLVCTAANVVLGCLQGFFSAAMQPRGPVRGPNIGMFVAMLVLYGISVIISFVGVVLFLMFLRRIAELFDNQKLARNATHFLIYQGIWILLMLGLVALYGLTIGFDRPAPPPGQPFPGFADRTAMIVLLSVFGVAGLLVYIVWYLSLLHRTRKAIVVGQETPGRRERDLPPR